ncbi:MAG: regulatory signaling modulator protein AmpE, partial [Gammaproteobacteria bacterium]|nr:regulatory signaling modulator protein AmpE [Gammaproteobacteria bacterium]
MNFLALILGLAVERLLTQLFHLRKFHWLDPVFDLAFSKLKNISQIAAPAATLGIVLLLILPIGLMEFSLQDQLAQIPLFAFAVLVLLFCLGPRDLAEE